MKYVLAAFISLLASAALAQSPNPQTAKMGITHTTDPEIVSVLSAANVWSPIGSIDKLSNIFTPVAGSGGGGGAGCPVGSQIPSVACAVTPATGSTWQTQETGFIPGTVAIPQFTVTSGGQTVAIPPGSTTLVIGTSSSLTSIAHCTLGAGPALASDLGFQPGEKIPFNVTGVSQFSCMVSSGTQQINATAGTGTFTATGGNGSTVTPAGTSSLNGVGVQFVSGGVPFAANPATASLWGILTQGSVTNGQSGELMMGAVTAGVPTYTNGQTSPLSLDPAGNLRVNVMVGGGSGGAGGAVTISGPLGPQTAAASVSTTLNGQLPAFAATPTFNCGTGCGSFTGTITGPLGPAIAPTAAVAVTQTGSAISGATLSTGGQGVLGWLSQFSQQMVNGSDAGNNAKTATAVNVTPISCATTVATGGTAVNMTNLGTAAIHGFIIKNDDVAHPVNGEPIWINFTGIASPVPGASFAISPATVASSLSGAGTYTTPAGFGSNAAVSVYAATSGHIVSCVAW